MKNLQKSFLLLSLSFLFILSSCTDDSIVELEQQMEVSGTVISDQDNNAVSDRSNICNDDLPALSFEMSYDGLQRVVAENATESLSGEALASFLRQQSDCYESEDEIKNFLAHLYSAKAESLNYLYAYEGNDEQAQQWARAVGSFFTQIENEFHEAPFLSLIDPAKENAIEGIVRDVFADVATQEFGGSNDEQRLAPCAFSGCEKKSYPSKRWRLLGKKGNRVNMRLREEGKWLSGSLCGFEISDFPGKRIIGTRSVLINWQALMLGAFHGGVFPYNDCRQEVFVHRLPVFITMLTAELIANEYNFSEALTTVLSQPCEDNYTWVKDKVKARKKNKGC